MSQLGWHGGSRAASQDPMRELSDDTRGVALMIAAMAAFTINDTCMKAATEAMPLMQAIFLRGLLTVAALAVIGLRGRSLTLRLSRRDGMKLGVRTFGEVTSTLAFLTTLTHMPIANLSALMQSIPLIVTLGAAFFLGARIGWRRLTAVLVGLVGVMIIIRPGTEGFGVWALLGIVAVLGVSLSDLTTRTMSQSLPTVTVAFVTAFSVMAAGGIWSVFQGWVPIGMREIGLIVGASSFIILGYLTGVMAMRVGDIGVVAPFRYTGLIFAIILGWSVFAQLPDFWTLVGSAVVVATGIYTFHRERGQARQATVPTADHAKSRRGAEVR